MNRPVEDNTQLRYKTSAFSIPIIVGGLVLSGALLLGGYVDPNMRIGTSVTVGIIFILMLLFGSLTVKVYDDLILVQYGIGLFRRIIDFHTLVDLNLVPNRFLSALYNLKAEHVVQVADRQGNTAVIGLGEARDILEFIRARIRR